MNFLISDAWAEGAANAAPAAGNPYSGLFMIIILFGLFYFLLIRPQSKRAKEHKAMVESLAKGDEVVTSGGLLGRVSEVGEMFITVEVAEGVAVRIQRHAVQTVMPKGTIKNIK